MIAPEMRLSFAVQNSHASLISLIRSGENRFGNFATREILHARRRASER
jgi:hypothetical protein